MTGSLEETASVRVPWEACRRAPTMLVRDCVAVAHVYSRGAEGKKVDVFAGSTMSLAFQLRLFGFVV